MKLLSSLFLATCVIAPALHADEPEVQPGDLPRIAPTEPADVMATFQIRKGFRIELVASEPMVMDPIAMCFDENGRLFVIEMRDYSERREEKLGRIRLLEDIDGDGKFDKSTVFLEKLPWPTAVLWYDGGLLVGACPDIIYAKDTDGDGVADETRVLFTGFGATQEKLNVQGLFNNFLWGLDNRIHGCSGHVGGLVTSAVATSSEPLDVRNNGLVIDPRTWTMTAENGGGQYGLSADSYGRLFTCTNSSHIETFMYDARYAARNPHFIMPEARVSIAADDPAAEVFRISPEEPWRVMRTRWRIGGLVGGPIEGGGRSAGYFTSATGITIYRGNAFAPEYVGDAFIGDVGSNLVHHKRIRREGLELIAERPTDEKASEFLASTDNWFRPVDFVNAPDGTLYIADMYREVIEHPWSIPPAIKRHLDLNSGNDRGRIYRIVPDGFEQPKSSRLGSATTADLVATLAHPNGWHRETASRLLFERQDQSAAPLLIELLDSTLPLARLHALCALDGPDSLTEQHVLKALEDDDATIRNHAIRLAEQFLEERQPSAELWAKLHPLTDDSDIAVRYHLAFTLGELRHPERIDVLLKLARKDGNDRWMQAALLSSLADGAGDMFAKLSEDTGSAAAMLPKLARIIGAKHEAQEIAQVARFIASAEELEMKLTVARALAAGASDADAVATVLPAIEGIVVEARSIALDTAAPSGSRVQAVELLGYAGESNDLTALLLDKSQSVQLAALAATDRADADDLAAVVMSAWPKLSTRAHSESVEVLLKRPRRALALLRAIQDSQLPRGSLNSSQIAMLHKHENDEVRQLAVALLQATEAQPEKVVEQFRPALSLQGDLARGKTIYAQRCISCHRAGGEGFAVGPDLVTMRNFGFEKLLVNTLDPNREVAPNYLAYHIETKDGQSLLGIITSDTTTTITLRQAYAKETVIQRSRIKQMSSQSQSLMPEGLEAGLSPQDMADLLEFVSKADAPP